MSDDLDPFESPRLLLNSSKEAIDEIERLATIFLTDLLGPVRQDFDPSTNERVLYSQLKNPFPEKLRILSYRVVSDCKHALDQAVGDAAVLLGRENASGIHFPIAVSAEDYSRECKKRLKHIHPELKDFVINLDTHEGGNLDLYRFLRLSGPNKHQRIVSVTTSQHMLLKSDGIDTLTGPANLGIGKWNRRKNEIEFARFGPGASLRYRGDSIYNAIEPAPKIVLKDGRPPFDESLPITLRKFLGECVSVVDGLEAETERIITTSS